MRRRKGEGEKEKDVKYNGTPVEGVLYETPPPKTAGVYVLNCGATKKYQGLSDVSFFVMKVGRSDDIPKRIVKHNSYRGDFAADGTTFLFGLKMAIEDTKKTERQLLAKLTQLGFARPLVTQFPAQTTETFVFNTKSLPLVHNAVCELRRVYSPPDTYGTREDQPPAERDREVDLALSSPAF
ncbi:hypothetical protein P3T76_014129 [Phytophthora citrophthora]|uniref:GIY-YIG domain-containing protein n=1 Tax=Phytophthora citrophthora TaxID=4793 RepID=A0AAD9LBH5_9STRA|nr:hypothetical protein P3T76_014129 [Phytophthora citrophthora]